MPQIATDAYLLIAIFLAAVVAAAVAVFVWALRSGTGGSEPWLATALFIAIFVLAAVLWPLYPLLLLLALPVGLIALIVYLVRRRRAA